MINICLIIEYDGSAFYGFQKQNDVITVQGEIEKAIEHITGTYSKTIGAGRTDTGVSSEDQHINFLTDSKIPPEKIKLALNTHLPREIVIKESFQVPINFHSRYSATKKTYRYRILNSLTPSAIRRNEVFHVPSKLDFESMEKAWSMICGKNDFTAFCKTGSDRVSMTCDILETSSYIQNDELVFKITGDSFLRGMVRLLIGTLILVGKNKIGKEDLLDIIKTKNKNKVGALAGAEGLNLIKIYYPEDAFIL